MVSADDFRRVVGYFATGVTVVTLPGDPPHGITANAFSSLSLDPPLVLVCIDHSTGTYQRFTNNENAGYCVNILTSEQRHLGEHFAGMTDTDKNPFESERIHTEITGAPVFEDALAYLDCSRYAEFEAGDHTIYIGKVERAEVLHSEATPLTFYEGEWGTIEE
jgi:flavin reductase (DIM6/NTAB) family NADH-FMN oxidoreductase RutF